MAGYMDKALRAKDPRFARILGRLGYERADMVDDKSEEAEDDLTELRAEYQEAVGKRAYHGWDADTLRAKIAEASEADD